MARTFGSIPSDETGWPDDPPDGGGSGAEAFLDLTDTPSNYTGHAGKLVTVADEEDGVEFTEMPTIPTMPEWQLAGEWHHSVSGDTAAPINFTGLAGSQQIHVVIVDAAGSVSSNMGVRVSTDNGSSFYSTLGNYVTVDDAGVTADVTAFRVNSSNSAAARSGQVILYATNVNGSIKADVMSEAGRRHQFRASTAPINAVQVIRFSGGDFTGGSIYCLVFK